MKQMAVAEDWYSQECKKMAETAKRINESGGKAIHRGDELIVVVDESGVPDIRKFYRDMEV